jgi:hypothetical protein
MPPAELLGRDGRVLQVREFNGRIDTQLTGPENPFKEKADDKPQPQASIPMTVFVDREAGAATIQLACRSLVLQPGQWSDFVRVSFDFLWGGTAQISGIVRFHLRSIEPKFELYASPINIDPLDPVTPISEPKKASAEVARAIGLYYTQGMPEDVNALKERVITDLEFLEQSSVVHDEGVRLMDWAYRPLARGEGRRSPLLLFLGHRSVQPHDVATLRREASVPRRGVRRAGLVALESSRGQHVQGSDRGPVSAHGSR